MTAASDDRNAAKSGSNLQVQLSPLLFGSLIAAALSTVALAIVTVIVLRGHGGPPGQLGQLPPPPPPSHHEVAMHLATAIFVITWIAVFMVALRDQILGRTEATHIRIAATALAQAEMRETEGYLRGMRDSKAQVAQTAPGQGGLRSVPPID